MIVGKRAAHKLFAGEQIVSGKLMGSDGKAGGAGKIPSGFRVVSVRVDAVTGASGLILPNDRVDVLVYLASNSNHGISESSTKTILQDVRVFAVDTAVRAAAGAGRAGHRRQNDFAFGHASPGREDHVGERNGNHPPGDAEP